MNTLFKKQPIYNGNITYTILLYALIIPTAILMLSPIVLSFMNDFSYIEGTKDIIYYILRGLVAITMIIAVNVLVTEKKSFLSSVPAILSAFMVIFPLSESIRALVDAVNFANTFNMPLDASPYVLNLVEYALFFLISVFTFLYCTGILKLPVLIMALGLPASIASGFTVYTNLVTYEMDLFTVLTFAYSVTATLVPVILTLSCTAGKEIKIKNNTRYAPKRYSK